MLFAHPDSAKPAWVLAVADAGAVSGEALSPKWSPVGSAEGGVQPSAGSVFRRSSAGKASSGVSFDTPWR